MISSIEQLPRYACSDVWGMEPEDDGEWLKRSDVLALLRAPTPHTEQKEGVAGEIRGEASASDADPTRHLEHSHAKPISAPYSDERSQP